ncbi:MAG: type IV pilus modification PilV family protein [Candidatus Omnitrophota bacterium]
MKEIPAGFTLIELVISIVVLGFAVLALVKAITDVSLVTFEAQFRDQQTLLGQELMEEIRSKRFDERVAKSGGQWSPTLGPDPGETSKSEYDDIDDYHNFSETLTGDFSGYTRAVQVGYVNAAASLTTVVSDPTQNLKLVVVTVGKSPATDYTIRTLIGSQRKRDQLY